MSVERMQELIDDIKQHIPDEKYRQMCEETKKLHKEHANCLYKVKFIAPEVTSVEPHANNVFVTLGLNVEERIVELSDDYSEAVTRKPERLGNYVDVKKEFTSVNVPIEQGDDSELLIAFKTNEAYMVSLEQMNP